MIERLKNIAASLKAGRHVEPVTVRDFLEWFGAQRRGVQIVHYIRAELDEAGLITVPDFNSSWIDAPIEFRLSETKPNDQPAIPAVQGDGTAIDAGLERNDVGTAWVHRDPGYQIGKLKAANRDVVSVSPDASLIKCVSLMMARDFSQLPVMTNERDVKGVISWKSIGSRLALGNDGDVARALMDKAHEVSAEVSIFDAIDLIVQHDYVLVRGEAQKITGIVTASDLSIQFRELTEPFLLLSEIENLVRNIIGDRFSVAELNEVRDIGAQERPIRSVVDLTFGEYIRLLENQDRWARLGLKIDRKVFCKDLDRVRNIRNDVTHFDPDGISEEDIGALRNFTQFLKNLEKYTRR